MNLHEHKIKFSVLRLTNKAAFTKLPNERADKTVKNYEM